MAPQVPAGGYRFELKEIEYLHHVAGQWVGLIGADYCAGWIENPQPLEVTMYYTKKLGWVKKNLPYASYFMSWNNVWGPYARDTPASLEAIYNDPWVVNREEIDWRNPSRE